MWLLGGTVNDNKTMKNGARKVPKICAYSRMHRDVHSPCAMWNSHELKHSSSSSSRQSSKAVFQGPSDFLTQFRRRSKFIAQSNRILEGGPTARPPLACTS